MRQITAHSQQLETKKNSTGKTRRFHLKTLSLQLLNTHITPHSEMLYLELPNTSNRLLPFYLAMEEFVARIAMEDDCFFMWQVEPTVIFGRNQNIENEVNITYCKEHDIKMFRRKSGGGCVYADMSNIMLSLVTRDANVNLAFNKFIQMVLLVFQKMGIPAVSSSHNDIMIGDRKVCGTACYHLADRSIVHSTLLYNTTMEHMLHAITPSTEKLQSKGIQSVRQRITLLKDHTTMSLEQIKALFRQTLCQSSRQLTQDDVSQIEAIEHDYLRQEFIYQYK